MSDKLQNNTISMFLDFLSQLTIKVVFTSLKLRQH
jgi:hypothetical protein